MEGPITHTTLPYIAACGQSFFCGNFERQVCWRMTFCVGVNNTESTAEPIRSLWLLAFRRHIEGKFTSRTWADLARWPNIKTLVKFSIRIVWLALFEQDPFRHIDFNLIKGKYSGYNVAWVGTECHSKSYSCGLGPGFGIGFAEEPCCQRRARFYNLGFVSSIVCSANCHRRYVLLICASKV